LITFLDQVKQEPSLLKALYFGIEKEGLRNDSQAFSSLAPHPESLGSKLKHPHITTDYSENLMEFITPVFTKTDDLFHFLERTFAFTYQHLDNGEMIWPASMPCLLPENEADIPVAIYGKSNIGKLKTVYRVGLGNRYGRSMQSIAGVHFNFSFDKNFWKTYQRFSDDHRPLQEFIDEKYFELIRNYKRHSWLLTYLFGCSPVVDDSFLKNKKHKLQKMGKNTFGLPYATSLRMGGLGYTSEAQKNIKICYNYLSSYIKTLEEARLTSYKAYEEIGLMDSGEFKQLNTHLLQIDNEFYSTIRPKRSARSEESALQALNRGGVEYIEVRVMDVDLFNPYGISKETMHFLHLFLVFCLFEKSPQFEKGEYEEVNGNFLKVVNDGRNPDLVLTINQETQSMQKHAIGLLNKMKPLVNVLTKGFAFESYQASFEIQEQKVLDPSKTPSHRLIKMINEHKSYIDVVLEKAKEYQQIFTQFKLNDEDENYQNDLVMKSKNDQLEIERNDNLEFPQFLEKYFKNIEIQF
jgi:glutamate--cysteine ligase